MMPLPPCDHDDCPKTGCAKPGSVQPAMIQVQGNRVLARPIRVEFCGRFALPEKTKLDFVLNRPRFYEVIAVGPGRRTKRGVTVPIEVQAGEKILCHSDYEGEEDGPDGLKLLNADTILAVFPPGATLRPVF